MIDDCVIDPAEKRQEPTNRYCDSKDSLAYASVARKRLIVFSNHSILVGMEFVAFYGTIEGACGDFYCEATGLIPRRSVALN